MQCCSWHQLRDIEAPATPPPPTPFIFKRGRGGGSGDPGAIKLSEIITVASWELLEVFIHFIG